MSFPDRALYAGVPNALSAFLATYDHCSRRSGRTSAMVAALQNNDCVVFADEKESRRVTGLARQRGVEIRAFVAPPHTSSFDKIMRGQYPDRRFVFDHNWIAAYWEGAVQYASSQFWQINERLNPSREDAMPCPKDY